MIKIFILWLALCSSALAQVPMTGAGNGAPGGGSGGGIVFTPTDAQNANPGFGSGTFTVNIGTPSIDRIVVYGIMGNSPSGIVATQINGVTPSIAAGNSLTVDQAALYYANVTTGTTATISYGSGNSGMAVVVGTLHGQSGGGSATPGTPVVQTGTNAQPISLGSLTVPTGGIGIVVAGGHSVGGFTGSPTFTWTSVVNTAGDETSGNTNAQMSMAHMTSTANPSASSTDSLSFNGTLAGAAWAP